MKSNEMKINFEISIGQRWNIDKKIILSVIFTIFFPLVFGVNRFWNFFLELQKIEIDQFHQYNNILGKRKIFHIRL